MPVRHDPELEAFKRTIDLPEYAKRAGYEPCPHGGIKDFIFLEHPNRDRIVVARSPSGHWIYSSVNSYEPREKNESAERALRRLRGCILREQDRGSIVDFVRHRDWTARDGAVSLDVVRERLREYRESGRPLDFEGPLVHPNSAGPRRSTEPSGGSRADGGQRVDNEVANTARWQDTQVELTRPQGERTPSPSVPLETDAEQRLRRWRDAEQRLDPERQNLGISGKQSDPKHPSAGRAVDAARSSDDPQSGRGGRLEGPSDLNRRCTDWTLPPPLPSRVDAVPIALRRRGPERCR
jgi:hypothetical protein